MTDDMPTSFKDGEFGYVPAVMLGGPIDGKRYKLPVLPSGAIPHGMGHPIRQPHGTSPLAYYERAGDTTVGGYYVYFFLGMRDPGGRRVYAQTPVIKAPVTDPVTEREPATIEEFEQTCAGYGSPDGVDSPEHTQEKEDAYGE